MSGDEGVRGGPAEPGSLDQVEKKELRPGAGEGWISIYLQCLQQAPAAGRSTSTEQRGVDLVDVEQTQPLSFLNGPLQPLRRTPLSEVDEGAGE